MDDPLRTTPGQAPVRRYPRMAGEYVVAYRRQAQDGSAAAAEYSRTQTLGLGGLMFESEKSIDHGEVLQLEIVFGEKTIKATGTVVYVDRQEHGPSRVGVQFTEISEDDRDALLGVYLQQEYRIEPA